MTTTAAVRSPRYPSIDLRDAVERVKKIYDEDDRHPLEKEVVAAHLGYNGINGSSNKVIAALIRYGLLQKVGEKLKVSDDAFNVIIQEKGEPERIRILQEAAYQPTLFAQLRDDFENSIPSNSTLKTHLLKHGFNKNVVDRVIKLYRDTVEFVKEEQAYSDNSIEDDKIEAPPSNKVSMTTQPATTQIRQTEQRFDSTGSPRVIDLPATQLLDEGWHDPLWFRISKDCEVRVAFKGRVTQKAMNKFIAFLNVSVDVYPEDEANGESQQKPVEAQKSVAETIEDEELNF